MDNSNVETVKTGEWFVTLLITAIPLVGLIMLLVWAFGSNTNPSKANWAKATLIWMVIAIAIYVVIFVTFGAAMLSIFG
jgi:hypothetical protein